jgi:hypothetical protein
MPEANRQRQLDVLYFLAVPALLALTMAAAGTHINKLGLTGGLIYLAALSFVPWWIAAGTTQCAHACLQRFRLPLWALGSIGAVTASLIVLTPVHELNAWFRTAWPGGDALAPLPWPMTRDRIGEIAIGTGRATALWVAFLYAFSATLGWRRYSYAPAPNNTPQLAATHPLKNNGSSWSEQADIELARYVAQGLSPREIAVHMQRTVPAVRARIAKRKQRRP